jgi:hypothetical protein
VADRRELLKDRLVSRDIAVFCADIGSIKTGRFGWARARAKADAPLSWRGGTDIRDLARLVASDLALGSKVALGFECPLFVPVPDDPERLTSGRSCDGNRPWSAAAGAAALATGLTETLWILREIRRQTDSAPLPYLDWADFLPASSGILVWEAFISGSAKKKGGSHEDDARVAVQAFVDRANRRDLHRVLDRPVRSLIGAALLQTGWTSDIAFLDEPCIVVKPGAPTGAS